ncbi:hypothetical protein OLS46_05830 [Campylobacter jejuni]|nr:hypothetical protein [Campylobacter jejuni]
MFLCEAFLVLDNNDEALLNEKIAKEILEYDEDEYILFILHKTKLNDTYLKARKELYKSIDEFKKLGFEDLENAYQTYINSLIVNKEIKMAILVFYLINVIMQNNIIFKDKTFV